MSLIVRTWLGLAALGAGLIHFAVSADAPFSILGLFAILGAAELAWGAMTIAREDAVTPRLALVGAMAPILVWAIALTLDLGGTADSLPFLSLGAATLLDLAVAAVLAFRLRTSASARPARPQPEPSVRGTWGYLAALAAGAAVVTLLTVPSIAATPVGLLGNTVGGHAGHGGSVTPTELDLPEHEGH